MKQDYYCEDTTHMNENTDTVCSHEDTDANQIYNDTTNDQEHTHNNIHDHENNKIHSHEHTYEHSISQSHSHNHRHMHSHEQTKNVLNRLSRAIGHLTSVRNMVEAGRDCSEVLIQLAAVRSAINSTSKVILKDHIDHCIVDAVKSGDSKTIEELKQAIDIMIK